MKLETGRLILRPWKESDAQRLYEIARDPQIGPSAGWPVHTSAENSRQIIQEVLSQPGTFAVCRKPEGLVVGCIGLMTGSAANLDLPEYEGEIGYWIARDCWGQGLIPEAGQELLRHGFEDLGLTRIWCGYFEGNRKSCRVQEKLGFRPHHRNEDRYWAPLDRRLTEHVSCLDRSDWQEHRKEQ